jgi:hypothetical protein
MKLRIASSAILCLAFASLGHAQQPSSRDPSTSSDGSAPAAIENVPQPDERVILKVGNLQITQADFETMVDHGRTYTEGKKINWTDGIAAVYHLLVYRFKD